MTVPEAIIYTLETFHKALSAKEIYAYIKENNLYATTGKTPERTISAQCGTLYKKQTSVIDRISLGGKQPVFLYYLKAYKDEIFGVNQLEAIPESMDVYKTTSEKIEKNTYHEIDLHALLVAYLHSRDKNSFTKTIRHQSSSKKNNDYQVWTHPDLISFSWNQPSDDICKKLFNSINSPDSVILSSYEMKISINNDHDLKQFYFQAVSNSSWANYGWLVALKISKSEAMLEEMERLNLNFGIGVILLSANALSSKVLFPARRKPLDFRTINKLCSNNQDVKDFIENVTQLNNSSSDYDIKAYSAKFKTECDPVLETTKEIQKYCKEHNIPIED